MTDPLAIVLLLVGFGTIAAFLFALARGMDLGGLARQSLTHTLPGPIRKRALLIGGALVALLWVVLFLHVLVTLFALWWSPPDPTIDGGSLAFRVHFLALVGLLTALAALVSFPLALERMRKTERQTSTAEQGHITDRINEAVKNLGADKVVNRLGRTVRYTRNGINGSYFEWQDDPRDPPDHDKRSDGQPALTNDPWNSFPQTQPNLEVRIGAIYALERIAKDSPRDHIQIMEILCAYIRQNAPAPTEEDNPHHVFWGLVNPDDDTKGMTEAEAWESETFQKVRTYGTDPGDMTVQNMIVHWVRKLPPPRIDIQTALTVIGRRSDEQRKLEENSAGNRDYHPDLRETDLRRARLSTLDLSHSLFNDARFEGSFLIRTKLVGSSLKRSKLDGANLFKARCDDAGLNHAKLNGVLASHAQFRRANLEASSARVVHLIGANLTGARIDGIDLAGSVLHHITPPDFLTARVKSLRGAGLRGLTLAGLDPDIWSQAFGDDAIKILDRHGKAQTENLPSHWTQANFGPGVYHNLWRNWLAANHADLLSPHYAPDA